MTTPRNTLMHTACIALFLMLLPHNVLAQDKTAPTGSLPGQTSGEPVQQKSDAVAITPIEAKEEKPAAPPVSTVAPAGEQAATGTVQVSEETGGYVVKQGDTLWDIANTFMRDPFLWPFIWKANPTISNPDLIYPGNRLAIPSLAPIERALQVPAAPAPQEQLVEKEPVKKEAAPEEAAAPQEVRQQNGIAAARVIKPIPVKPKPAPGEAGPAVDNTLPVPENEPVPLVDKYVLLSAGYVDNEEYADIVAGTPEPGKSMYSFGDTLYVKIHDQEKVNIGDKYLIYSPMNQVKHPRTGKKMGRLVRGVGILEITAKNPPDALTAKVTLSFGEIVLKCQLTPYQEPALIFKSKEKKSKDISGYIIEVTDTKFVNAENHIVYLDKGIADDVEPGDKFTVYVEHKERGFPMKKVGEALVLIVKQHTSTAQVSYSTDYIKKGDVVVYKK